MEIVVKKDENTHRYIPDKNLNSELYQFCQKLISKKIKLNIRQKNQGRNDLSVNKILLDLIVNYNDINSSGRRMI